MPTYGYSKNHQILDVHLLMHPKFKISEHAGLYLSNTLRVLSVAFVGVFLPIYIYELSFDYLIFSPDKFINGATWVLLYFFLRSITTIIAASSLLHKIFKEWKFAKSIAISISLLAIEMILWIFAEQNLYLILISGAIAGWHVATYWIPYHIFFVEKWKESSEHFGQSTAKRIFLSRLASAIAPAIGGVIIVMFGFKALFVVSLVILGISSLPTLFIVHDWEHKDHSARKIIKNAIFNKKYKILFFAYVFESMDILIYTVFWPLMLFILLDDFEKVGFITGFSMFASSLITLLVGKLLDKGDSKKVHLFGIINNALLYIARFFVATPIGAYIVDIADRANSPFYSTPNMTISYEKARKLGKSDFMVFRELSLHFSIAFTAALALMLLPVLPDWKYLFIIAAIGSLGTFLFDLDKN